MSERSFRARSLLLEGEGEMQPLLQLRDADHRHQGYAMARGYNSLTELCIDEMLVLLRDLREGQSDLQDRVADLEAQLGIQAELDAG